MNSRHELLRAVTINNDGSVTINIRNYIHNEKIIKELWTKQQKVNDVK